jgi:hypothetical protein
MFYKPNFCCNCGEKIERPDPSFTDSRRFCDVCKHEFVLHRAMPVVFAALMAIIGIFGIGSYWRSGEKPLNVSARQFTQNSSNSGKFPATQTSQISSNANVSPSAPAASGPVNAPSAPPPRDLITDRPEKRNDSETALPEARVYYCGAPTKKGTPCSRRVKGGGRCWQHQGQNALLPPEKLLAGR